MHIAAKWGSQPDCCGWYTLCELNSNSRTVMCISEWVLLMIVMQPTTLSIGLSQTWSRYSTAVLPSGVHICGVRVLTITVYAHCLLSYTCGSQTSWYSLRRLPWLRMLLCACTCSCGCELSVAPILVQRTWGLALCYYDAGCNLSTLEFCPVCCCKNIRVRSTCRSQWQRTLPLMYVETDHRVYAAFCCCTDQAAA